MSIGTSSLDSNIECDDQATTLSAERTAIVILNWQNWSDTIECLETVFSTRDAQYTVFVSDNASENDSVQRIIDWAAGRISSRVPEQLRGLIYPKIHQRLSWREVNGSCNSPADFDLSTQLIVVRNSENGGFAAGNNSALRLALASGHFSHYWLLNSDTAVPPDALPRLLDRMRDDPAIGICGSRLMWHDQPEKLQAAGGAVYDWSTATSAAIVDTVDPVAVESRMSYVIGASMLVSDRFLRMIGLMTEDYFLYFEEMDWSVRSKQFSLGFAADSIVYHKQGGSIGSNSRSRPSNLSLKYLTKNRLLFTSRYRPKCLPSVMARIFFEAMVYLRRRDLKAASILLLALVNRRNPSSATFT